MPMIVSATLLNRVSTTLSSQVDQTVLQGSSFVEATFGTLPHANDIVFINSDIT
jgi:hypothetical protein